MKIAIQCDDVEPGADLVNMQEIQRRGEEMDVVEMPMADPDSEARMMRMAMLIGAWQGELRVKLDGVVRQIERIDGADDHWDMLRRQVETSKPEIARYMDASVSSLTKMESKIFLLAGLNTSPQKIAEILNITVESVNNHRGRICGKLNLAADARLDELFGSILR